MGEANGGKRRFFSAEFKLEAVHRMEAERARGVSLTQIGRELGGVRPDMLREWRRQAGERGADLGTPVTDVLPGQGRLPSEAEEVRRLTRELERVTQERDFLRPSPP
jgi:transposase-like protein